MWLRASRNTYKSDCAVVEMYKNIEEYSLNAWPALQSFVYDGWLLKFADGFTKRANSISPMYKGESKRIKDKILYCESIYSSMNLDTIFKLSPFVTPRKLDRLLSDLHYEIVEPSRVMTLNLSRVEAPHNVNVRFYSEITDEWSDILANFNNLSEPTIHIAKQILSKSFLKKGFFTLFDGGIPVACGIGVIEQNYVGLYDIVTDRPYRFRGYGKQLILNMLKWAKMNGATDSYLQVVKSNEIANQLYEKLGYKEAYTYWYRYKKLQ